MLSNNSPINYRDQLLQEVFRAVSSRLQGKEESLRLFASKWHSLPHSAGGIEGWLKVEFVAAIDPGIAIVYTGSSATKKNSGKTYPDLILKTPNELEVNIELKASTNWSLPLRNYDKWVIFFLCGSPLNSLEAKRKKIAQLSCPFDLEKICGSIIRGTPIDFLFGFLDLGDV